MENSEREKILNRISQLVGKALEVKATHRPNPPNVISSVTLDTGSFSEWKNSVEGFILKVAGEKSSYYKNFVNDVKYRSKGHVDAGIGILMALKGSIEQGDFAAVDNRNSPSVDASGGAGGHGGSGPGGGMGGDGGAGGSAHFIQVGKEFTPEGITIQDLKNPHQQYWKMLWEQIWGWIKNHTSRIVIGVVIVVIGAAIVAWLGLNK